MSKNATHILSRAVIIDQGHILLCKTLDMKDNFYFLPGGHVEHGESASNALIRELIEESGFRVVIQRFLGCLENGFESSESCKCHNHEYSFIFEASNADLNIHRIIPKLEAHIVMQWLPLAKLSELPFKAEALKQLIPQWLGLNMDNAFQSTMK